MKETYQVSTLCHKAHNSGKGASIIPNAMPDGVISAQDLLRRMPFEINIQSPASKELVSTKGKNTELSSCWSSMKTVSNLLKEDMKRRSPNCLTDEMVRNFGDPLFSSCDEAQPVETEFDGADQGIYSVKL